MLTAVPAGCGEETVTVAGKDLSARWTVYRLHAGKLDTRCDVKVWVAADNPCGVVKADVRQRGGVIPTMTSSCTACGRK